MILQSLSSNALPWGSRDDLLIHYTRNTGMVTMTRHQHPRHEVYYLMAGQRDYFIRDRVYRVRPGDLVVIPANDLHKTHPVGHSGFERMLVEFSDAILEDVRPAVEGAALMAIFHRNRPVIAVPEVIRPTVVHLFARLVDEAQERRPGFRPMVQALLLELLVLINRLDTAPSTVVDSPVHRHVSEVSQFLQSHSGEPWRLESVAQRFGLSPAYLSRIFPQVTGVRFHDYLLGIRVARAKQLLLETDLLVAEVAERTGFDSQTSFGRAFLRLVGVSPRRFRAPPPPS